MELKRLEAFIAIVDTGTFAAAADELGLVQSTISANISALERELAVKLFDRSARAAVLTAGGRALVPQARELLLRAALTRRLVQDADVRLDGELNLGVISPVTPVPLPQIIQRFSATNPHVTLHVLSDSLGTRGLVERMLRSELDLAILAGPLPDRPMYAGLVTAQLTIGNLVCVVSATDPLAAQSEVRLEEIAGRTWVESLAGQINRGTTDAAFAAAGLERTVAVEIGNLAEIPNYVAAGIGIAIIPEFLALGRSDIRALPVAGVTLQWSFCLARLPERNSSVMRAFWSALLEG